VKSPGAKKLSVDRPRAVRPLAIAVVFLLAVATLFSGSHCLLGGMKANTGSHSCCSSPPAPPPGADYAACCASLAAPIPGPAVAPAALLFAFHPAWPTLVAELLFAPVIRPDPRPARAHAPPGPASFCELVLARSLPAHAPPSFVA